jgi:hypothetical protein
LTIFKEMHEARELSPLGYKELLRMLTEAIARGYVEQVPVMKPHRYAPDRAWYRENSLVSDVHDRMPVIVRSDDYDLWLDPGIKDTKRVASCLRRFDANLMKKYPVSARVNRPDNDDEECAKEVPLEQVPQQAPLLF